MIKPRVFIGSSLEGKRVANAIHAKLRYVADCTVWTDGVFGLSAPTLASLMKQVEDSEFGIFVFSPDDVVEMRDKTCLTPRDNVVYELGLFSGRLGPERCFFVQPQSTPMHLPSDLAGIAYGEYEDHRLSDNAEAAVNVSAARWDI